MGRVSFFVFLLVCPFVAFGAVDKTKVASQAYVNEGLALKANVADLAAVATSGSYNSLTDQPTIGTSTLTIQKNGVDVDSFSANATQNKTINITVPTTAADVSALPSSTKYGSSLTMSIDNESFIITTTLKDQNGDTLGTAQTIDLPLETMVIGASYNDNTRKIILTLKNGQTVDFSVADLVSGLQSEITSSNKLSSDLVDDTGHTNKFVTAAEKTAWNNKVTANDAITGATHTKITYDSKGLVTSGSDITLSDITDVTASAAEVNVLDGITASTAEINLLDGVTATTTELNYVDGVTSNIQTQLNSKLDANTAIEGATKTKITYDDNGLVTAGADLVESDIPSIHLSKVSDVTATAAELNVLDGITATTTELNYVDGVTSNIQTQLNSKMDANNSITGATKTKVTYDSRGLITGGADLQASDIPSLSLSKISDVTASANEVNVLDGVVASTAEINHLSGVTSAIQTQLDDKVAKNNAITGAQKTKITYDSKGLVTAGADLEESDVPALHLSKISDVTATAAEVNILDGATVTASELNVLDGITATTEELNFVHGVSSNIQTQLNGKQDNLTIDNQMDSTSNNLVKNHVIKDYVDGKIDTSISSSSTNTQVPSALATYTFSSNAANLTTGNLPYARVSNIVGTSANTVAAGNDSRFNSIPTSRPTGSAGTGREFVWLQ